MKYYFKHALLFSTLLTLTSCFAQPPAPYVDKSKGVYNKGAEKSGGNKSAEAKRATTFTSYDGTPAVADTDIKESKLDPISDPKVSMVEQKPKQQEEKLSLVPQQAESKPASSSQALVDSQPEPQVAAVSQPVKATTSSGYRLKSPLNLPNYEWPLEGNVLSHYGKLGNKFNEGVNVSAPLGAPVTAASDGKVVYIGNNVEGYGNLLILRHDNDLMTAYAHLKDIVVERGATVKKGESVGSVGQAGNVSQPQLHFSVRKGKKTIDPELALQ